MWRSFFFAVGTILILLGVQCLILEEFRIDENSRLFTIAKRTNLALDETPNFSLTPPSSQVPAVANQQRFSLPSATSYYGGPSRFQNSGYDRRSPLSQQSLTQASNPAYLSQFSDGYNRDRVKAIRRYPVADWMPWGFLAAGTIISLYTNSTGRSNYSRD